MATKSKRTKHKSQREEQEAALAKQMRPVARFLLSVTNDLDWGEKYEDDPHPCPMHVNTKETMRQFLERTSYVYPKRLSQKALIQHFQGKRTLYFTGSKGNQTLVYIDPDCHKSGSKEGAFQFLEYLKSKYFLNLYYEVSTHGNGGSGYIIVDTSSCSELDFNILLKQFDKFLKRVLATTTFDVEDVEAKGAVPEVNWNPKYKNVVDSMKCGGLAKFPREMLTRADEFMNTTQLTTDELQAMVDSVPEPLPVVEETKCVVKGSVLGKHIDPDLIKCYLPLAKDFMDSYKDTHNVGNHTKAIAQDLAAVVTMIEFFTRHPNEDGSMPHARFKTMWDAMYECGDISRAWDNKRFAYLRNMLSDLGMIEWQDETYIPKGGKAMCWHASDELMDLLEKCRDNQPAQTISNEEAVISINKGLSGRILCGKLISELKKKLAEKPIIRPKMMFAVVYKWFDDIEGIEQAMNRRKKAA
jgi:hypothetical protein